MVGYKYIGLIRALWLASRQGNTIGQHWQMIGRVPRTRGIDELIHHVVKEMEWSFFPLLGRAVLLHTDYVRTTNTKVCLNTQCDTCTFTALLYTRREVWFCGLMVMLWSRIDSKYRDKWLSLQTGKLSISLCKQYAVFLLRSVCLSVHLITEKVLWTDFDEISWRGGAWPRDQGD